MQRTGCANRRFESRNQDRKRRRVGDTEERVKRLYRYRITVEPHHYEPQGHYLNYSPAENIDRRYGIVFETDGVKVTSYRVGTLEAIALVERCS